MTTSTAPDPVPSPTSPEVDGRFERFVRSTAERSMLFVRLRLGPDLRGRLEPWDVLQEAYVHALEAFPAFRGETDDSFARWMCRIAENTIRGQVDHFGAEKRKPPADPVALSKVMEGVRASLTGAATAMDRAASSRRLETEIAALPVEEREVVLLRFFQDRTLDEIASLVGRSPTAVRRSIGRATARLGEALLAATSRAQRP